jgi:hypothetical protein
MSFLKDFFGLSEEKSKVQRPIDVNSVYGTERLIEEVNIRQLRQIVLREPLLRKAIVKKNRDTFKNWFVIRDSFNELMNENIYRVIKNFDKKSNIVYKLMLAGISANIYGTGFIEKIYNEHGNAKAINPVQSGRELIDLHVIDSECITKRKRNPDNPQDKTMYLVYEDKRVSREPVFIHPSRIEVVKIDELPYNFFGISVVNIVLNVLKSKMNADISSGEILNWFGHGIIDLTIEDMNDEQEKNAKIWLDKKPDYFVHDQDYNTNVINPSSINPSPFYDYFYTNIAAVLDMPKHMLIGAEIGGVTGSEVGVAAYYSDIENIQKLIFTPTIENIYTELLKSRGKPWNYYLDWNPIFVDELSDAKILQTRAYAASQCVNAVNPILSIPEARKLFSDGYLDLDPDDIPDKLVGEPEESVSDPNIEPQPVKKPEKNVEELSAEQLEMIKKYRILGERELEEQEKRLKEAGAG